MAPGADPDLLLRATATLSLMVGAVLVLASVLRVGFFADFISEPVLCGFKAGIGIVVVLDQMPKLLGLHFPKGSFLENLVALFQHLPETSVSTLAVGLGTIGLLVGVKNSRRGCPRRSWPSAPAWPPWRCSGSKRMAWRRSGTFRGACPRSRSPRLSLIAQLWPGALGIALMSFTETVASARAFARIGEPALRPNQELLATGMATAGGAVFGAMPAGGGTSQTAVNLMVGARSQLAGLITGGVTLLTLLFFAPFLSLMPQATLAAVVIVYSAGLIQVAEFRAILAVRRTEFIWAVAAFAGVLLLGTLKGVLVAVVISLASSRAPGRRPAGVPARPQAGDERVPSGLARASRRRDLWRPPAAAPGGPAVLRQRAAGGGEDASADR